MDLHLHHRQPSHNQKLSLNTGALIAIRYHSLFGFALTDKELIKWSCGRHVSKLIRDGKGVIFQNGFYFLENNERAVAKRLLRRRFSLRKRKIAERAAEVFRKIPTVKMVGITGSLAMNNADEASDIDLLVIAASNTMWVTRAISYLTLKVLGFNLRRPKDKDEKDKLCLNMWIDEKDLTIDKKNIYTAHEIAQIIPLVNKEKVYERFISENSWIKDYWPNAVRVKKTKIKSRKRYLLFELLEPIARGLQFAYMSGKVTSEKVTSTRAFFHPFDWGDKITREMGI